MEFRVLNSEYFCVSGFEEFLRSRCVSEVMSTHPEAMFFVYEKVYIVYSTNKELWNFFAKIVSEEKKLFLKQIDIPQEAVSKEIVKIEFVKFRALSRIKNTKNED